MKNKLLQPSQGEQRRCHSFWFICGVIAVTFILKLRWWGKKEKNATLAINYSQLANFHAFNFKRKGKQELKLRTSKLLRNLSLADSTHRSCAL